MIRCLCKIFLNCLCIVIKLKIYYYYRKLYPGFLCCNMCYFPNYNIYHLLPFFLFSIRIILVYVFFIVFLEKTIYSYIRKLSFGLLAETCNTFSFLTLIGRFNSLAFFISKVKLFCLLFFLLFLLKK